MNLRGVKESGRAFAIPTYGFVVSILLLLAVGFARVVFGDGLTAESAGYHLEQTSETGGLLLVFLVLRAFASGCTALTGVEAVSNGVPAFKEPKSRNAAATLVIMGGLAIVMFAGITGLAIAADVHMAEDPAHLIGLPAGEEQKTALSQIALATFGSGFLFYLVQGFTAAILILAANTAFNGFPVLSSLLGRDNYLPHQLSNRGDRLVFSNGIVAACWGRGPADRRLRRERHPADPALHPRGVPLVHSEPDRDGAPLGGTDRGRRACGEAAAPAQAGAQRPRRRGDRPRLRRRAGDEVRRGRLDRRGGRAGSLHGHEGRVAPLRPARASA